LRIVRTVAEMRAVSRGRVGLVPTMGAFHEGHISLMREARKESDLVVCSLFVNPTQFGPNEDFKRYPRNEDRDALMAEEAGVDILFAPSVDEMYNDSSAIVTVPGVSELWEGAQRPGHFDGVATVVCKLLNIASPDVAYFGLKDLQQCAVIRRMVKNLFMPVGLKFCPTLREADGVAMSSRNVYLSAADRSRAPLIHRELERCASIFRSRLTVEQTLKEITQSKAVLADNCFSVNYFALVDTDSMQPRDTPIKGDSIIVAARLGTTRLIDNIQIS
jgi:pantoate--beta-alanine ligase